MLNASEEARRVQIAEHEMRAESRRRVQHGGADIKPGLNRIHTQRQNSIAARD